MLELLVFVICYLFVLLLLLGLGPSLLEVQFWWRLAAGGCVGARGCWDRLFSGFSFDKQEVDGNSEQTHFLCVSGEMTNLFGSSFPVGAIVGGAAVAFATVAVLHKVAPLLRGGKSIDDQGSSHKDESALSQQSSLLEQLMLQPAFRPLPQEVSQHPLIVCVGHGRTGTTSLARALEILGLRTAHYGRLTMELVRLGEGCGSRAIFDPEPFTGVDAVIDSPVPRFDARDAANRCD